ncbi:hypothetical protein DRB17_19840 [Ferruginivarius sediminum]|uniref:Uncharacterized protein n=2 Tax=Ferruginivarius sediminum TaxID=2661937 RepID=A0A369T6M4_9PROT|nr:hypothetical protein DRB17_19840 [Ferruginivarius sediminum]
MTPVTTLAGMKNEHTICGLIRKRAEIASHIEHLQTEFRKAISDPDHVDKAIHLFDSSVELAGR